MSRGSPANAEPHRVRVPTAGEPPVAGRRCGPAPIGSAFGRLRLRAAALALALAASSILASGGEFESRISAARAAAAAEPRRGLAVLRALRTEAVAQQQLAARLAIDEAECRVLTDLDVATAIAVADAGISAAGAEPGPPARLPWLRLRVCRAGTLLEAGAVEAGRNELESVLAASTGDEDLAVLALARLERGVHRSRTGELESGQRDLIESCAILADKAAARDRDLCLGHLANHYRRVGDADEALRILLPLRDAARRAGASYDDSVYTFGIAQAQHYLQRWDEALISYRESVAADERLNDDLGVSFGQTGIADVLLRLGRATEALAAIERALSHINPAVDPRQYEVEVIALADALNAVGRAGDANSALDRVRAAVRQRGEQGALAQWLAARAQSMRLLGRWSEAFDALEEARSIENTLQRQRMSLQSARLRMQFNRERDNAEISVLRRLNEQSLRLRETQALALGLFVALLVVVITIAARKIAQVRHLRNLASTDELTGIANRRAVLAHLADTVARARREGLRLAVLMIDIDHFKRVNDTYGHAVGDDVIRHATRVMATALRERDRLGRIGGEEFLAVLDAAAIEDAAPVAERMRAAIAAAPRFVGDSELRLTVSIGVAGYSGGESPAALVARADVALLEAKRTGRNAVVVAQAPARP